MNKEQRTENKEQRKTGCRAIGFWFDLAAGRDCFALRLAAGEYAGAMVLGWCLGLAMRLLVANLLLLIFL
jgi:hypothetical protein